MTQTRVFIGLVVSLLLQSSAFAFETRFQIDPTVNLAELTRTGKTVAKVNKINGVYHSDASAVLSVDATKIFNISADFDRFQQMGMPNVQASRIVERQSPDVLYTWTQMSTTGKTSKHYLEVRFASGLTPSGAMGSMWQQTPKKPGWAFEEDSSFDRLEGSWYVEPLANGKIYVRYYLYADLDTRIPGFIVDMIAGRQFKKGVEDIIAILAREAAARP